MLFNSTGRERLAVPVARKQTDIRGQSFICPPFFPGSSAGKGRMGGGDKEVTR